MGTVESRANHVEIKIDHQFAYCTNISSLSVMAIAMKRTDADLETPLPVQSHFLKRLDPHVSMSFPVDTDIVDPKKLEEAQGMDYVVMVWPYDQCSGEDPRRTWSPEVFIIKYEPTKFKYFPAISLIKDAAPLSDDAQCMALKDATDFCTIDWGALLDQTYALDLTTQSFETDRTAPANMLPWMKVIDKASLDSDTEYFCVETWGVGPMYVFPRFYPVQKHMFEELKSGRVAGLVGCSGGGGLFSGFGFKAETLTVWTERRHMAAFFQSDLHKNAMEQFRGKISFKVRRLWIRSQDLPDEDVASTKRFWERVKGKEFKEAVKPKH